MLASLNELVVGLKGTGATAWENFLRTFVAELPGGARSLAARIANDLDALNDDTFSIISSQSRETSTHYAWCLTDQADIGCSVWLNEYKPMADWLPGYANVAHNHRYEFITLILRGWYREQLYDAVSGPSGSLREVTLRDDAIFSAGTVRTVPTGVVHRINELSDRVVTLLVKMRPTRRASFSIDIDTGISRIHVPVEQRKSDLIRSLSK